MSKKKFVLRIDEATMEAVERWASDEFRSVNGQLEWMINNLLNDAGRTPKISKKISPPSPKPDDGLKN